VRQSSIQKHLGQVTFYPSCEQICGGKQVWAIVKGLIKLFWQAFGSAPDSPKETDDPTELTRLVHILSPPPSVHVFIQ
jgi:hypothetical protein